MIQAMYSGVSGLKAFKSQLDVIGNNIANLNTVGFKSSRVSFQEMMSQTWNAGSGPASGSGGINPIQVGLGVTVGAIATDTSQGSLQATGNSTDLAVEGSGYFMLGDGHSTLFSRDGSFSLDGDFNLVASSSGYKVLGWHPDPVTGGIDSSATPDSSSGLKIPIGNMSNARQTSLLKLSKNVDLDSAVGATITPNAVVYDSLGSKHALNIAFTKTSTPGEWDFEVYAPDVNNGDPSASPPVLPTPVKTGTATFDSNGKCTTPDVDISMALAVSNGSTSPFAFKLSLADVTQLAGGGSTISSSYQDGLTVGTLQAFNVGRDGVVTGIFGNGNKQVLGQIALATFSNSSGLVKAGSNMLSLGPNSGIAQVAPPGSSSSGALTSGFLEASNVDLSNEFANMIIAQRGFQANARTITTSDEIIQELVQLKR